MFSAHGVVAEATGEFALGAVDLSGEVVALDVADELAVKVQLVQVAAAVVQVVEVLACGQGQRGEVAQWIVFVVQRALGCGLFDQTVQQEVGEFELLQNSKHYCFGSLTLVQKNFLKIH